MKIKILDKYQHLTIFIPFALQIIKRRIYSTLHRKKGILKKGSFYRTTRK